MKRYIILLALITIFSVNIIQVSAQEETLNEKIKNLKGDVEQITIKTTEGELTLSDEDAEKLFKRIKMTSGNFEYEIITNDGDDHNMKIFTVKIDEDENEGEEEDKKVMVFVSGDDEFEWNSIDGENMMDKDIKIEINDSVKKVTVTTTKDGEKSVKVYEGEDAEKYLEEHKSEKFEIKLKGDKKKVFIKKIKEKEVDEKK